MEVRRIPSEQWSDLKRLHSIVYNHPLASAEASDGDAAAYRNAWGVYEGRTLCSAMTSHEFAMMHDGAYLSMAGIGGVGTLPEHRRQGHVRRLFEAVFADMRDKRQVFSALYPFSFPYYRMFGYELVYSQNEFTLPLDSVDLRGRAGTLELVPPPQGGTDADGPFDTALADVKRIYESFARPRNLSMERPDAMWRRRQRPDPYKEQVFTYLMRADGGEATAYFTFHAKPAGPYSCELDVRDIGFVDIAALRELLPQLAGFYPRAEKAMLRLPSDVALDLMIGEPYDLSHRRSAAYMGRIVDVEAALASTRWPDDEGSVTLRVRDEHLDWNDATFRIDFGDGDAAVARVADEPDVSVDVRALVQLLCGYVDGASALAYRMAESRIDPARLRELFPAKPLYQNDAF
ncbi:MAG: GNAT family N-acetyltransferase [Spirochaetaceae bacterium]|nr:MAG: GNAT family N-acetyltransferase [Spirochaetaceae bacterium]